VAFSELTIESLRPGGIFALILPSQAIAACNTARLRGLLLSKTTLDQMILLPRSAFADATVRGLVLVGRVESASTSTTCRVTTFPIVKSLDATGPARTLAITANAFRELAEGSWWPLLTGGDSQPSYARTIQLENLAHVTSGVQVYHKGRGVPPQTSEVVKKRPFTFRKPRPGAVPAIAGRDVHELHVSPPGQFIKLGKWLAHVGKHDFLRQFTRIFVRELCRRDGKLTAAVASDGLIPLHGVLTVVPKLIDPYALVGILNSSAAAEYVKRCAASFSKVDFQKITVSELRQMPIPIAAVGPAYRSTLALSPPTAQESSLCNRLTALAQKLSQVTLITDAKTMELRAEMETVVSALYSYGGRQP
jgi:hypothetical protein